MTKPSRVRSVRLEDDDFKALQDLPYRASWHIQEAVRQYLAGKAPKEAAPKKPKAEEDHEFEQIWELYERKGSKKVSRARFAKLSRKTRELIYNHLPAYLLSTPDKRYRKDFERYISNECWNDEVITNENNQQSNQQLSSRDLQRQSIAKDIEAINQLTEGSDQDSNLFLD